MGRDLSGIAFRIGSRPRAYAMWLMNSAPSGLVWWCSRQRRRPWSRDLHESRSVRVAICTGHDLRGIAFRIGSRPRAYAMWLMNSAPSGLVRWCSRQRRRPWGRDLHGGRVSAWSAFCIGCPAQAVVPERRHVVVSGADERCGGLIVLAWRGFVVLGEQAAAQIAAAAQARAPVPTRVVPIS
jgi:hypothetical protein